MLPFQSVNLAKSFTPVPWATKPLTLAAVFLVSTLVPPSNPIATTPLDPILATPSQDEALYAHGILRMAAGEDWLTPRFLGRPLLVKPPLMQWLSAASHQLTGSLRLPSILAAAGVLTIVYQSTGPVGWLLLAANPMWRNRAGLVLMDDLLILFFLLAITAPPRASAFFTGLAIMTKWFAGILPLALFFTKRPSQRTTLESAAILFAVVLPWHLYQLWANHDWFLAEYLGVELLGYAFNAPVQASAENWFSYYLPRLAWLAPLAVPLAARRFNPVWVMWSGVLLASIAAYSYRNTTYLAPLAPALLLCHRGWIAPLFAPLALVALLAWPSPQPQMPISNQFEGREVLHLDPDDQLRTTLFPGATVRYIFLIEHLPPNGPLDFERLGIAKSVPAFLAAPEAKVDVVLAKDLDSLKTLILSSPQRDFLLPPNVWRTLAIRPPHEIIVDRKVWLRSRSPNAGPRPNRFQYVIGL
jgi:hypothetical protein